MRVVQCPLCNNFEEKDMIAGNYFTPCCKVYYQIRYKLVKFKLNYDQYKLIENDVMRLRQTKYLASIADRLNTTSGLIEKAVLRNFNKQGFIKDNYLDHEIDLCINNLLKWYELAILLEPHISELRNDIINLEITI